MRVRPRDLDEIHLQQLIQRAWGLQITALHYATVGYGSHHWVATTSTGERRFVTVDEVGHDGLDRKLSALRSAMSTAVALRDEAALEFVVAPQRTCDGQVVASLDKAFAVAVFPFIDGHAWLGRDSLHEDNSHDLSQLLARLHAATPSVSAIAATDDLEIEARGDLKDALAQVSDTWAATGPYTEGCRNLLATAAENVRLRLDTADRLATAIRGRGEPLVLTHGEPKPDNLLLTASGPVLIDWDTALLAPAARDLWWLSTDASALADYAKAAGRNVPSDDLAFYRLRWDLTDVALYVRLMRGNHVADEDSEIAWRALNRLLQPSPSRMVAGDDQRPDYSAEL